MACGAPAVGRSGDENVTERHDVAFDVTGAVYGSVGGDQSTWQQACDAWVAKLEATARPKSVQSHDCGMPTNVGSDSPLWTSHPVAHLVVSLPKGVAPIEFSPVDVFGTDSTLTTWASACNAEIDRVAALYGPRLLAATCADAYSESTSNGPAFAAPLSVWIEPPQGASFIVRDFLAGTDSTLGTWKADCDAFVTNMIALSGVEHLADYHCGFPKQAPSSVVSYQSRAMAMLAVPLVDGSIPTKTDLGVVTGADSTIASWETACQQALTAAKTQNGDRFLGGFCDDPTASSVGAILYTSHAYAWLGDRAPTTGGTGGAGGGGTGTGGGGGAPVCTDPTLAANCTDRCLAMSATCGVGPQPQTCDSICSAQPTECQLACAEQTSCDNIDAWFQACGLQ